MDFVDDFDVFDDDETTFKPDPYKAANEKAAASKAKRLAEEEAKKGKKEEADDDEALDIDCDFVDDFDVFDDPDTTFKPDPYKEANEKAAASKAKRLAA